jgi:hypothetical protein
MASIKEVDNTLADYYTMSDNKLIITARMPDVLTYFYDHLGPYTTIIILTRPASYLEYRAFLEAINDLGSTAIPLDENEYDGSDYLLGTRAQNIVGRLLKNYTYRQIIMHPNADKHGPQNRELYNFVTQIVRETNKLNTKFQNKLHTYDTIGQHNKPKQVCDTQLNLLKLYCTIAEGELNRDRLRSYLTIASSVTGLKLLEV